MATVSAIFIQAGSSKSSFWGPWGGTQVNQSSPFCILHNEHPRGPKSLNFPDGNFQRAKTFRTKCVNRFRDKKSVRKFFLWQKRCINSFCDKKSVYRLFLQQNKCAQIIFATFQAIWKLSRYPKLSRLSGNFLDHPENMQPIRKRFRLSRNFSDHQENIQPIRKISSLSGKHPAYPENIQPIRKLSSLSGNFSGYPETFQAIQKLSRSSGKYPAYPENFQTIRKKSRLSGNFPKGPETSQCNFKGYAQKLSGWQCHPATQVFGTLQRRRRRSSAQRAKANARAAQH